jgi:prepilin-type N-terminal cleavage/methylation domain-containing protein
MRSVLADTRGMTVAEILIAVAIIGVGLVALSAAIPLASYGIQEGNQLSTATFLANQRLEQIRNAKWETGPPAFDNLGVSADDASAPSSAVGTTFPDEAPMAAPYANYSRQVRITDCGVAGCSGIADANLRQVTVSVSYRPMTGVSLAATTASKSAVVSLYITKR